MSLMALLNRLPWSQLGRARRCYSVRIPNQPQTHIKTIADLKAWLTSGLTPNVEVSGWVRSVRKASAVRFIDIADGSSMRPLQVVVDKNLATGYVSIS